MEFYEFDRNDAFRFANFMGISTRVKGKDLLFTTCPYCHSTETWLVDGNQCVIKEIEAESEE